MAEKNKKKMSKKAKVIVSLSSIFGAFLVLFVCAYFIIGNYFFKFALDATFSAVYNAPSDEFIAEMPMPKLMDEWFVSVEKNQKEIKSGGYSLKAYEIMAETDTNKWVITIHGYRGQARDMSHYAYMFHEEGFNVLMPNLKGHGQSEGKYIGMGYTDSLDILKWIDVIIDKDPNAQIVLHGVSMGGATVMFTTGHELPENVVCAIEDCGYSSVYKQFKFVAEEVMDLPAVNLLMSASNVFVKSRIGVKLQEMNTVKALKKSTTPTMFIHGTKDNFVPYEMLDEVYNANSNIEKEKLVFEGATHAYSATLDEERYFNSVFEFVNKYLN
ncbi:MAG: alpha/beta hydrolase [Clostridia bacterium]|nr:alpha/beta hydrolase [Clostridia bacterium]